MKRLVKKADNNGLGQYILDILKDDINPIINELNTVGIGYGYNETINKISDLIDEFTFVSKKAQEMDILTDISWYCTDSINRCKKCKNELAKWNEDYTSMSTETKDDKYEQEEFEYFADKLIIELTEKLFENKDHIESEINK